MCSYFCKNLPVVMYRKFRNVPIFKGIPPICPYFLKKVSGLASKLLSCHFIIYCDCCMFIMQNATNDWKRHNNVKIDHESFSRTIEQ